MRLIWDDEAWEDYLYRQTQDKKTHNAARITAINKRFSQSECIAVYHRMLKEHIFENEPCGFAL